MKAVVFTLGCKVNECESDSLIEGLLRKGYEVSDKLVPADIYVVNTCAVTAEAEKKSRQTVSRIRRLNPEAKIIFTGCAAQKSPTSFAEKSDKYLVTGNFKKSKILDMIDECGIVSFEDDGKFDELLPIKPLRTRAYVKVQDGCDNFCSYCVIPYLRGRSRSRAPEKVLDEVSSSCAQEVVINGINLSAYEYNGINLAGLMRYIGGADVRVRLGSLEERVITEDFLSSLTEMKNFAPQFHLSLQSGSDAVLKKMNRKYTRGDYLSKVKLIRKYFPYAGITTDIIAGFPTETEEDFVDTLNLIDEAEFSDIHPFIFSPRQGTAAYKMKDLEYSVKKSRLDKLLEKKTACKLAFATKNVGREELFLGEEVIDGYCEGYAGNYLRLYVPGDVDTNKLVKVKIVKPYKDGAVAEKI